MQFSYFKGGATSVKPIDTIDFNKLIEIYQSSSLKQITNRLKAETDEGIRKTLKNQQNFITPSGVFTYRNNKNIIHHNNNLIAFDFDGLRTGDAENLKQAIFKNESCIFSSISSSGKGVKAFVVINEALNLNRYEVLKFNQKEILEALNIYSYLDYLDLRQFVLSQPMYLSYDENILFRHQFKPLDCNLKTPPIIEKTKIDNINLDFNDTSKAKIYKYIEAAVNNLINFYNSHKGARHSQIAKIKAISSIIKYYNLNEIKNDCYNAIESAIISMYGGYNDAIKSNAIKSMREAWEVSEPLPNKVIDDIIKQNQKVAIITKDCKKLSDKATKITDIDDVKMILPTSLIEFKSNYIIIPRWLAEKQQNS